jgi:hypothetical protein
MQGSHTTNRTDSSYRGEKLYGGRGYEPPGMISDPVKAVGVGGGRTIYGTGTQSQHGQVAGKPSPQGREILREYGRDYKPRS